MVRGVMNLVYKEVRGLHQAAYVLGAFAFGSQLLALVRDRMLAHQFGAGIELDLYYAAFRIPDVLYVLFASTLSVYVLIPFVAARMRQDDAREAQVLLGHIFSVFLFAYAVLAFVLFLITPWLVPVVFPGLSGEAETITLLIRILLLQPLFLGLSSLFGVVTQLGHRFVLYAISPLIYNLGIILGIGVLYPMFGLPGLVYGVVLGAFGHLVVQIPLVQRSSLAFRFNRIIDWNVIREVLVVSIPRAATLSMHQLELLILVGIASSLTVGSVAVFQLAFNLQSVPLAIVGASYSTAAFPLLADLYAQKKFEQFRLYIITALRHIIFWSVPIIGLIIVLRAQMVRVVLGTGEFDWGDTRLTAAVLALLTCSLLAQAANLLLMRTFYAGGYTRTPLLVSLFGTAISIVTTVWFYNLYQVSPQSMVLLEQTLRIADVAGAEVVVIAIGYSVGIFMQTSILLWLTVKQFSIAMSWFVPHLARSIFAALVGASAAYLTINVFVDGLNTEKFLGIFLQGTLGGILGVAGVVFAYYLVRSPELSEIYRSFHTRIFKTQVVASQDDVL
jgi:putative peptidoglycan lipid II flippase